MVLLSPPEYSAAIKGIYELKLDGGITYDILIPQVAQKAKI